MNYLRSLWPGGLAGQIAACVVASLLFSQVFTALLAVTLEPRRSSPPLATAERLALLIATLDVLPASDRLQVSAAVREQGLNVEFSDFIRTTAETELPPTRYLLRALKERLGPNIPLRLDHIEEPGQTELLIVGTRLGDGTPVRIEAPVRDAPSFIVFGLTPFLFLSAVPDSRACGSHVLGDTPRDSTITRICAGGREARKPALGATFNRERARGTPTRGTQFQ